MNAASKLPIKSKVGARLVNAGVGPSPAPAHNGLPIENLVNRLDAKRSGDGWIARCPAHDDGRASLSIAEGGDGRILINCHAGCSVESIVAALGLTMKDLFPARMPRKRIVATYDYADERGALLFQTVRYEPKDFKQRRPDPERSGGWIYNLKNIPRVLYRLPELKAAIATGEPIYVGEGEKDVDDLVKHGFNATCNPLGAKLTGSTWLPAYTETLRGAAKVVVIADKDKTGRAHARIIATALHRVTKSVKLIELPDCGTSEVKDVHDFFAAGDTDDGLKAIVNAAPEFVPAPKSTTPDSAAGECRSVDDQIESESGRRSAATQLIKFADEFAFFHDAQNRPFVRLEINDHIEIWPVNGSQFRNLLASIYYKRTGRAINRNAIADAISTLAGRACHDSPEEAIFLRVAPHGENVLIDLCDSQWRIVEVTRNGRRVLDESPVAFIRTGAMRALPTPISGRSLDPLWELLNVTRAQRPLVAAALLNYFHPYGPYFVLNFVGEQGTAKSCAARIIRQIIDPNENPLRSPPREERDLIAQAGSNWCVAFDNLSSLPVWLSNGLCRLSTGGGHSARMLYTDLEEISLAVKRPVILNGIEDVATRPDLAERALQIELETIADRHRISEKELWRNFEAARPLIFSALLDGLVCALRESPTITLNSLPRMADPALWATAGEAAFGWERGTFMAAYSQNLQEGAVASVEAHPVGVAICELLSQSSELSGEPAQLLKALNESASDELRHAKNWPQNPRSLSVCLRRLAPALRRAGIQVEITKSKRRHIRLCKATTFASPASPDGAKETSDASDANFRPSHDEDPASSPNLVEEFV